ncbi:unnamed protein product [Schistosoma margrebowiei]|uniref:G patch domain-containing protein n=1 Tax=Schistosoma margrebowiei TaxID=48269 RepID=A0AA84ZPW6_9TREM|nr:unnamed protein product [Schistosoma margrebowiei]
MSSPVDPEEYSFVAYGDPFSDDEDEQSRFRGLALGKRKAIPSAYENRVLNERGRPMRFHGAFTGGFSAGYFNSVGSKEGFKPKSFHSSRKNRQRDLDEKFAQHPEDFMDDEDFGEFGIAPRRIRPTHEFDDTHVRDTLQLALGDQSVIPQAGSLLKGLIVATRGTLAERLLRRLGWKNAHSTPLNDDTVENTDQRKFPDDTESITGTDECFGGEKDSSPTMFAQINFVAKTNTFGLGYSPLDPEVAMGRRKLNSNNAEDIWSNRHPEESVSALLHRQQKIRNENEFDLKSGLKRHGITGHAFGVGALEEEDADVYEQDRLAEYDWEIGDGESNDDEDEEQAEIEAARLGRLSSTTKKKSQVNSSSTERTKIIDGWTAPSQHRSSQKLNKSSSDTLPGFCSESTKQNEFKTHPIQVTLPPGYIPVFNPRCILTCDNKQSIKSNSFNHPNIKHDAISRARLLEEDSVYEKLDPIQQLRLQAAAAGLPVPALVSKNSPAEQQSNQSENSNKLAAFTTSNPTAGLLKIFKADSNKQARFEAYQVLVRRGFAHEDAYHRCSTLLDLNNEEKEREANSFQTLIKMNQMSSTNNSSQMDPVNMNNDTMICQTSTSTSIASTISSDPSDRLLPLSNKLPLHKQQLISSKLALRFRSAGCMDISKELTEEEEKAQRARVESLDTVEPRDHAVATESYGALTRRRLKWHPDKILCKRINVPDPYPDSTFIGCPDDRRPRNPFRQKFGKHGKSRFSDSSTANEFSIFDLLDVNTTGSIQKLNSSNITSCEQQLSDESYSSDSDSNDPSGIISELPASNTPYRPDPTGTTFQSRGKALFATLFQSIEQSKTIETKDNVVENNNNSLLENIQPSDKISHDTTNEIVNESNARVMGPSLPKIGIDVLTDHTDKPPMDLFKSIFASDEELSSSSLSDNDVDDNINNKDRENDDLTVSRVSKSNSVELSNDQPDLLKAHTLFSHLFEPNGDMRGPLSGLTRMTTRPEVSSKVQTPSQNNLDPDLLYGPDLPPNFTPTSDKANPISLTKDQEKASCSTLSDDILFVESHLVNRGSAKHKKPKNSKRKHKTKHKKQHKSKKVSRKAPISSSDSNSSDTSD